MAIVEELLASQELMDYTKERNRRNMERKGKTDKGKPKKGSKI